MRGNSLVVIPSANRFIAFGHSKGNKVVGGDLLLGKYPSMPIHGEGFSNHIIGIASPPPSYSSTPKKAPKQYSAAEQYERGSGLHDQKSAGVPNSEAVAHLSQISFARKQVKHQQRDNIKFVV